MACRAGLPCGTSGLRICVSDSIGAGLGQRAEPVIVGSFREIRGLLQAGSGFRLGGGLV